MIYITDESWARLPMADFRPRFFVETYIEKLGMNTPHFSQARLMNVFSSCSEALIYIDEYHANDKNSGYILSSLDEIESCLSIDPIAKALFTQLDSIRLNLFKSIKGNNFNQKNLSSLSVICKAILSREDEYSKLLLDRLTCSLTEKTDLSKSQRILSEIYNLTDLYVTYLLNKGYSPTYLFNRSDLFTRINNYSGRNFQEQFKHVTDRLNTHKAKFEVYFSLKTNKPKSLTSIEDDPDFKFSKSLPDTIIGSDLEKIRKEFEPNVIAIAEINATDYVTASWRIKDKLDTLLDAVTALELNTKIQISSNCATILRNKGTTHVKVVNINLLIGFLASESGSYFTNKETPIRLALTKLDTQGKEQLGRSLRYLRLARETVSLEQKLLNLWIALESLFASNDTTILSGIIEYLPSTYATTGLIRRVFYLRDLLAKSKIPANKGIKDKFNLERIDNNLKNSQLFALLRDDALASELFDDLSPKAYLKYKLKSTLEQLKNNETISKRIKSTEADVTRQLRRIYFLRNKITHTGHHANIRPQLITHLLDYLAVCYMAISSSASVSKGPNNTIEDLLGAYKIGVDVIIHRSSTKNEYSTLEELTPLPMI